MTTNDSALPPGEQWFVWRVSLPSDSPIEGREPAPPRLLVPRSDPFQYEMSMDLLFRTPEEAMSYLETQEDQQAAIDENWVLCRMVLEPLPLLRAWELLRSEEEDLDADDIR